jgi:hypothetical protein
MQINYEDFYKVSPDEAIELVDQLERGDEVRSVRDQVVKTSKEIAHETATAGVRRLATEMESVRTIGGETPREDTKPGFRPPVHGDDN